MSDKIERFQGSFRFLSNFWPARVWFEDEEYPSVEHAYQAAKTFDQLTRTLIRNCAKPGDAKRAGRHLKIRSDWDKVKVQIMYLLLKQKFQDPELLRRLISTGDSELIEGNDWNDTFWGVCRGRGENNLGKLIMLVRKEARDLTNPTP